MNDNDKIHEPQFVRDVRNTIGYFLVTGFVTCGVIFILTGLFAPCFYPKAFEIADKAAGADDKKETRYRWIAFGIVSLWFILSWLIIIAAYHRSPM